ncbi:hypothetical protein [Streptomyces sp. NPDC054834]
MFARRAGPGRSGSDRATGVELGPQRAERLALLRSLLRERQTRAYEAFTPTERVLLVTLLRRLTELVADSDTGSDRTRSGGDRTG